MSNFMNEAEASQFRDTFKANRNSQDLFRNDPVGLPDDEDLANLRRLIKNYNKANPGVIKGYVEHAKQKRDAAFNDFSTVSDLNMTMRHVLTLPIDLMREIEKSYPIMFVNQKHLNWFKQKFPMFLTTRKT